MTTAPRTSGGLLAKNAALNLGGWILPMIVAVITVPMLIRGYGTERFGVLTLGWVIIGYFGLFDLGLGRALTKLLAERFGTEGEVEVPELFWTALLAMAVMGGVAAIVLSVSSEWVVARGLKVTPGLMQETGQTIRMLALSLPWVISTAGLIGALEAGQRFGSVNAVRVPSVLFNYLAPLAVLPFSDSLVPAMGVLLAGRVLSWAAYLTACFRAYPALLRGVSVSWKRVRMLARFGGWMTISNIISPVMTQLDRFLIGALISVTAVAYYTSPYEVVTRLALVPAAVMGVFFPAFAATYLRDRARTRQLFGSALRLVLVGVFPAAFLVSTWAPEALMLWLGEEFARNSTPVLRWLAFGVLVNSLAQVAFALVQGVGRPDAVAKLHAAELPLYLLAIWFLAGTYGIEGVAMAWVIRMVIDTVALFALSDHFIGGARRVPAMLQAMAAGGAVFWGSTFVDHSATQKTALSAAVVATFAWLVWNRLLTSDERHFVRGRLTSRLTPSRGPGPSSA